MKALALPTPSDLSESSFEDAIRLLAPPSDAAVSLYCTPDDVETAEAICEKRSGGFAARPTINVVPAEIVTGDGTGKSWAVTYVDRAVYSLIK